MLKKLSNTRLNIVVAVIMILTTFLGYLYTNDAYVASALWPAAGFAVGFYYAKGKKILPGLVSGILIAHLFARFFLLDEHFFITILFSIVFTITIIFEAYVFNKIMEGTKLIYKLSYASVLQFTIAALSASLIGAIISVSIILLVDQSNDFLTTSIRWAFGDFSGIMIFGIPIIFSFHYDKNYIKDIKNTFFSGLFLLVFTLFSFFIFSDVNSFLSFQNFSFIFMVFFFLISFYFSYRMIITVNGIFILMYQLLIDTSSINDLGLYLFGLNLFLFVLSSIAITTKAVLTNLEKGNQLLKESNIKFENLLDSTNSLFKLSDELLHENVEIDESYLIQMFNIATTVFENYDYASCYIKSDEELKFIAGYGYDVKILNKYFDNLEFFEWNINEPIIIRGGESTVVNKLNQKYSDFKEIYPTLKYSIRFNIFVKEGIVGGMSFDIMENSDKKFTLYDLNNFRSFQKLMNSFYEVNYLNSKNNNLKNDIVLSLIRTLELYDHYTGGHSEEVAFLAERIATRMNLEEKDIYNAYWAGIVHDIGKVGIPSDIINKAEKLTLEEYEKIKDHPIFGYEILNKSEDLKEIALLVKHHHEWWNGEGYPDNLKKEKIPLGAQILCVCDAVSSMATKRPYTLVKSSREIIKELQLYKGIQFSPIPTEEMVKFIEEGLLDEFYKDK